MIRNAFTGESWTPLKPIEQQGTEVTVEGTLASGDDGLKRQAAAEEAAKALLRTPAVSSARKSRAASPAR